MNCIFEPKNTNSSATICKWCGLEKSKHNQINMENTPKQKAIELYHKFYDIQINPNPLTAAKCALILSDEIIKNGFNPHLSYDYWEQVKEEIEKIKTR